MCVYVNVREGQTYRHCVCVTVVAGAGVCMCVREGQTYKHCVCVSYGCGWRVPVCVCVCERRQVGWYGEQPGNRCATSRPL